MGERSGTPWIPPFMNHQTDELVSWNAKETKLNSSWAIAGVVLHTAVVHHAADIWLHKTKKNLMSKLSSKPLETKIINLFVPPKW